jgi:hypothetical protein
MQPRGESFMSPKSRGLGIPKFPYADDARAHAKGRMRLIRWAFRDLARQVPKERLALLWSQVEREIFQALQDQLWILAGKGTAAVNAAQKRG